MSVVRRALALVALAALAPSGLAVAQAAAAAGTPTAEAPGAVAVTADELRTTVGALAADSMRGRDTPSPELDAAARWLAARLEAAGAKPGLGPDGYLQRFPVTVVDPAGPEGHRMTLTGPRGTRTLTPDEDFVAVPTGRDARTVGPLVPWRPGPDPAPAGAVALVGTDPASLRSALESVRTALDGSGTTGAVIAVDGSSRWFGQVAAYLSRRQVSLGEPDVLDRPVVLVRAGALPGALARAAAGGESGGRTGDWSVELATSAGLDTASAPNVVGWVEGTDPELRGEYVVVTAHLDHLGVGTPVNGDSVYNGADDDGSGVAALEELAEAFAADPPRRSVVLMAVSGEEKGLLGSRWYAEHPVFPLERTVAAVNLDMIGRNWRDTVAAIGSELSSLGATARRVASERAALGLTVVGDLWPEENYFRRSDHYQFARRGVPSLFFFSGIHEDYHAPGDEPDRLDYEKTARIVRLVEGVVRRVADADERPSWDPEAYDRVVDGGGGG